MTVTLSPAAAPSTVGSRHRRPAAERNPARADLEGLRALAIGLVLVSAAGVRQLAGGFVGVDVFFVLSGFLSTWLLVGEFDRTGRISLAGFYARRLRRIVPASTLTLLATVVASGLLLGAVRIGAIARDALWSSVFLANFRFLATSGGRPDGAGLPSPLLHLWPLAVGAQFFLVWPALLWLLLAVGRRLGRRRQVLSCSVVAVLTVASLLWCLLQSTSDSAAAFFYPWTRAWELGVGALVAFGLPLWRRMGSTVAVLVGYLGVTAIVLAALTFDAATRYPGHAALLPVAGAAAVIAAGTADGGALSVRRVLSLPPARLLGCVAYASYLWHWPVLTIAEQRHPGLGTPGRILLVVASVGLGYLTHRLIERPVRFSARTASTAGGLAAGLALTLLAAAFTNAYVVTDQGRISSALATARLEQAGASTILVDPSTVIAQVAAATSIRTVPTSLRPPLVAAADSGTAACYQTEQLGPGELCYLGDRQAANTVVLYGDSHAGMWSYPLDLIAQRARFKLVLVMDRDCPAADLSLWSGRLNAPDAGCDRWHSLASHRITQLDPGLVVLASQAFAPVAADRKPVTAAQWQQATLRTIRSLYSPGRQFALIGDTPYLASSGPDCLLAHSADVSACSTPRSQAVNPTYRQAEHAVAVQIGARFIDPTPWLCSQTCTPVVNSFLVYRDRFQLTSLYASYLAGSLAAAMGL